MSRKSKNPRLKIMRALKLNEISAVDTPAQESPVLPILKRADSEPAKKGYQDMVDLFTTSEDGHQHGVTIETDYDGHPKVSVSYASGGEEDGSHDHQIMRGANGELTLSENHGHTHDLDASELQNALLTLMVTQKQEDDPDYVKNSPLKPAEPVGNNQPTENDMAANEAGNTADITKRDAQIAELTAIVNMSAEHRAHYETLTKSAKTSFLNAEENDREASIEKAVAANPVVYTATDGTEFRKKDDTRLIAMAKKCDAQDEELAKAKIDGQQAAFEKTATEQLSLLPGEVIAKVALLKGIAAIEDEDIKKQAVKILADANKIAGMAFQTVGQTVPSPAGDSMASAQAALDAMVEKVKTDDGLDVAKAYQKVLNTSEGVQLQQLAKQERRAKLAQG